MTEDELYFDGVTYEHDKDYKRLKGQVGAVYRVMSDGKWRTLEEISMTLGFPQASVSARLRDLRKARFGAHEVQRRRFTEGQWEYRLCR